MLEVVEIDYIRFLGDKKDYSYAEIARKIGCDPRTVKRYLEIEDWNSSEAPVQKREAPVMDPVKPIIDQWLVEDLKKKKKYRRTAKRIHTLLVKDYRFKGSERSVRDYVMKKKRELLEDKKCSLPLDAVPGTAQVDFGEASFKYKGEIVDLSYLVLSFPYSNSFYMQVFKGQNKECFMEGLKRIFQHLGGVPRVIRFDNLSPAVKKVLPHGKRELTEEFHQFVFHYNFEVEFCNPGKGNEKGHVEAMVKYIRNNFFIPEPVVNDLERFNESLWTMAEQDRGRPHYVKETPIADLFEEDKAQLLMLPNKAFEVSRYMRVKADSYGKVSIDQGLYSTSPRFAKSEVWTKLTYDSVQILDDEYSLIVSHPRLYGKEKESMKWQPYLLLMAKRPMALKYTSFYRQLPEEWQNYLSQCKTGEKQAALRLLSDLLKEKEMTYATQALAMAAKNGHPTPDSIRQIFIQLVRGRGAKEPIPLRSSLPVMPSVKRNLRRYDCFLTAGGK